MAIRKQDPVAGLFVGLLPQHIAAAYEKLFGKGRVPKEHAADFLGGADVVKELCDWGMAHAIPATPNASASFQAAPPVLALQGVLAQLQAEAMKDQERLLDGLRRLSEAQTRSDGFPRDCPEHLVKVIIDREEILRVSTHLVNSARRDWMTLETAETDMPLSEDNLISCPSALRGQVRIRGIYDAATTRIPAAMHNLQRCVDAGEEVRILSKVLMKLQLADRTAALLPLTPTGTGGAILLRAAPIIEALRQFFELLWIRAMPLGGSKPSAGSPLTPIQQDILKHMVLGEADETIARQIGRSPSTVRRNIDAITELAGGADNRFVLGVLVQRLGWLPRGEEGHD
ncbi:MAG: response regulator transcription factor [Streptosporangiaceae bacterium]|nr:response regulator transcription factor [Streptosporangiaceae bacterium]